MFLNVVAKNATGVHQYVYRGHAYDSEFDPEVKLEALVQDEEANDTAFAILKAAGGTKSSVKAQVVLSPVNQVIFDAVGAAADPKGANPGLEKSDDESSTLLDRLSAASSHPRK
ncbi:MAG TPA: hypothetical protein VKB84_11120 [Candidatus Binataceae bacterium]|nr:hypothetical protein [Candidatus Binataceae bacterium]